MASTSSPVAPPPCLAVHLDLKGLPPTDARLLELPALFRAAGFNAVLVEWEDMFPWTVDERFRSPTCYSPDTVRRFASLADEQDIELIPLVQCLGHMETPLRLPEYAALREQPDRCDCLNAMANGARTLIEHMADDVLDLLPNTRRFHLGGDEAWAFGTHPDTRAFAEQHGKDRLYLQHVEPILDHLNQRGIRPLLWHDMMIDWRDEAIVALSQKADLVVWGYNGHPDEAEHHFNTRYIERFHQLGVPLWGAGAYKGADGTSADLPDMTQRLINAHAWQDLHSRFDFVGLIATAWSRYSTFRVQNEPIDAALDALVRVGRLWRDGQDPGEAGALDLLRQAGQAQRFETCRDALRAFSLLRLGCWRLVRECWENIDLARRDPIRTGAGSIAFTIDGLRTDLDRLAAAAQAVESAWQGLVDPRWMREYLDTRLEPLRQQLATAQQDPLSHT